MAGPFDRWTRNLVHRGLTAGLLEGSDAWLIVGALSWLARLLWRRPGAVVQTETLRLGESIVVTHVPAPARTRRQKRKALRRAAKDEARTAKAQAKREASRRYRRRQAREAAVAEAEAAAAVALAAAAEHKASRSRRARRAARKATGAPS